MEFKPTPYSKAVINAIIAGLTVSRIRTRAGISLNRFNEGLRDETFTDEEKAGIDQAIKEWKQERKNQLFK